ncbi:Endo-1,4-beta-xylanase A precursor [compost metagenome]
MYHASVNGTAFALTRNDEGGYSLVSTGEQIRQALGDSGELVITVNDVTDLNVELPVTAMGTAALTVITDFGTVTLSGATLQNIMKLYGVTLKLHISKGSYSIGLLVDGRPAAYDSPDYPLVITLPFQLAEGQDASAYVVIRKTESTDRILPLAAGINGSVTFTTSATGTYDVVYNGYTFGDVPDSYWAEQDIAFVAARGLLTGTGGSSFSPGASMTRAMFVKALANLEGIDGSSYAGTPFTDVPEGKWYTAAVNWAARTGIVRGTGQGRFSPDERITREEMAAMLYAYAECKGDTLPAITAAEFADGGQISPWAKEAADRLAAAGILTGQPGGSFSPGMHATRAEAAAVFARFIRGVSSN